jgi:hypothetical protein
MPTSIYCTYLTSYSGNKLPPFYIGHTTVDNIQNGYRGSVQSKCYKSIWKDEQRNNPSLFKTKIISYHKTKQEAMLKEETLQRKLGVVDNPLYTNQCIAGKLYFSPKGRKASEETKKKISQNHKGMFGRKHSEETKQKISAASVGNKRSVGRVLSEETKKKISTINLGRKRTQEQRRAQSERQLGRVPWNIGKKHSRETREKIKISALNREKRKWVNDGIVEKLIPETNQIPEGFCCGRIPRLTLKPDSMIIPK